MNATAAVIRGTKVQCVAHAGRHTGTVVAVISPVMLGVKWDGAVAVPKTGEERAFMKDLSQAHSLVGVLAEEVTAR